MADDRDALALADPEGVEPGRLRAGPERHLTIRARSPTGGRLIGLVDEADPVGVDLGGATQEIVDRERDFHV